MKQLITIFLILISSLSFAQNWLTNLEEAKIKAQAESKNIVLVFSGSDWCTPCIKLEKNIWMSDEFKNEAAEKWILVKANFPRKKANQLSQEQTKHNRQLAEKYNKEGSFPLVVILSPEGKLLGKTGFKNISPSEYIDMIHSLEK